MQRVRVSVCGLPFNLSLPSISSIAPMSFMKKKNALAAKANKVSPPPPSDIPPSPNLGYDPCCFANNISILLDKQALGAKGSTPVTPGGKKDMDKGELLMAEILAMGGSKQDLELLDGIDSGSEIEDLGDDDEEEDEEEETPKAKKAPAKKTDKKKKASEEIVEVRERVDKPARQWLRVGSGLISMIINFLFFFFFLVRLPILPIVGTILAWTQERNCQLHEVSVWKRSGGS